MKKVLAMQCLVLLAFIGMAQPHTGNITILHSNDLHSRLCGFAPENEYSPLSVNDDFTLGGFSRIASLIATEKSIKGDELLVLDAGDFLMGSFFHTDEAESGFQLRLMKRMGYDVLAIGNHEFDYGPGTLARIINNARLRGEIPLLTCANLSFDDRQQESADLKKLYDNGTIAPYHIVTRAGMRIGIFGILGYDAYDVAPKLKPVVFLDPVKTAKRTSKHLKAVEKVDLVICLSHSGLTYTKVNKLAGEEVKLAENCPYIDLIISGHSHTLLIQPMWINDIMIVQAGAYGTNIGKLELSVTDGRIVNSKYRIIQVNDEIFGDNQIQREIEKQKDAINKNLLHPLGFDFNRKIVKTDFDLVCDEVGDPEGSNLGPLIADAIYYYVNKYEPEGTDVAMIAAGMIRDKIKQGKRGFQTVSDIFNIVSLGEGNNGIPGYPLAKVYVTGKELKNVLEVLLIAPSSSTANYCYFSGVKIYYNPEKGMLRKIQRIEINGTEVDCSKYNTQLYGLVANSYMLEFVGIIKKMTFGLVSVFPKHANGDRIVDMKNAIIDFDKETEGIQEGKEWFALIEFFESFDDCDSDMIPDIPYEYAEPRSCLIPVGNSANRKTD